ACYVPYPICFLASLSPLQANTICSLSIKNIFKLPKFYSPNIGISPLLCADYWSKVKTEYKTDEEKLNCT
ncbi:hypothetical protein, partial [uncultured Nostoc sp.]|uniref:hypothetical protein n=1 Tax=uncultured Nostoc sp. TaxID=340711 RepID=UPI0035CB4CB1